MGKHTIFVILALTLIWTILMEEFSWQNAAIGMFMSMLCLHMIGKFLPFKEIENVDFYSLILYPFWLISQIYRDAFFMIKRICTGAKWGIITDQLELENEVLRIILADSITLIPGSIFVDIEDDEITILTMCDKNAPDLSGGIEGMRIVEQVLIKAQKT